MLCLSGVSAYSLFQNLCFPLANGTPCINWTGSYYTFTDINITASGDGNNYPTSLSVNQTGNDYTIVMGRNGLSDLEADFEVNATGSSTTLTNGTGINITGTGSPYTVSIANLEACNPVSEYSVWDGVQWSCDNDGGGTSYTFDNTDGFINISGGPAYTLNANITTFDARYVLTTIYDAFVSAIYTNTTALQSAVTVLQSFDAAVYTNVTGLQSSNTTTNARIDSLNTTTTAFASSAYTNISALTSNNTLTNARLDSLNNTKLNETDQRYNETSLVNAAQDFAETKAATGSTTSSTQCLQNLSITNTSWSSAYTDCGGSGGGVTSIDTGAGLTGGPITTTGTISTNATTCTSSEYSYWNGTAWLCRTDTGGGGGGSGNLTGNGTANSVPVFTNETHVTAGSLVDNLTRVSLGDTTKKEFFVNGYNRDNYNLQYVTVASTEFCEVGSVNNAAIGGFKTTYTSSGLGANVAGTTYHPCITSIQDSTTANGGVWYMSGIDSLRLNGTENTTAIWRMSNSGKPGLVTFRHGFHDTVAITRPTDGCYWEFNFTTTNIAYATCANNGARTQNDTYTPSNLTWYITNVEIDASGTFAQFRLYDENGTLLRNNTIYTNIPLTAGRETGVGIGASENNTGASSTIVWIDYLDFKIARRVRNIAWI